MKKQCFDLFADKDYFPFPKKYVRFACALVMDPQLQLVTAVASMTPGPDMDALSTAIFNVFSYMDEAVRKNLSYTELDYQMPETHQMYIILRNAMQYEINNTSTPETVLRQNSIATKLMQQYIKLMNGVDFLHKFCRPIIGMVLASRQDQFPQEIIERLDLTRFQRQGLFNQPYNDIEIDPTKIKLMLPNLAGLPGD